MGTNVLDWIETHMRKSILHFGVHGQIYNLRLSQFRLQIKPSNERKHLLTCVYILLSNWIDHVNVKKPNALSKWKHVGLT